MIKVLFLLKKWEGYKQQAEIFINIWYLFITNRVKKGKVLVIWCPTEDMIGDYMKKPL